jgi:hypothetical protein
MTKRTKHAWRKWRGWFPSSGSLGSGTYTYDGNGLRVKKVFGSTTTVYIFSGSKVVAEYDNGAAPTAPSRLVISWAVISVVFICSGALWAANPRLFLCCGLGSLYLLLRMVHVIK